MASLVARTAAICLATGLLTGCGSMLAQAPLIGEPENNIARPAVRPDYPVIGVRPSEPDHKPLTAAERAQAEAELSATRAGAAGQVRQQINQGAAR
jgi:hypothetical protein